MIIGSEMRVKKGPWSPGVEVLLCSGKGIARASVYTGAFPPSLHTLPMSPSLLVELQPQFDLR